MRDEQSWTWAQGAPEPLPGRGAKVSALDLGYLTGTSLYETLRTYGARPFSLKAHLDRLEAGALRLGYPAPPREKLAAALRRLAFLRAPAESCLRFVFSPGERFPLWEAQAPSEGRWTAYASPLPPFPPSHYERGVHCIVSRFRRTPAGGFSPAVKVNGSPDLILARREAEARGAFEAILLNGEGWLAEGASSALFLVLKGRLVTPPISAGILDSVTRSLVLALASRAGLPCAERPLRPEEAYEAEEAFLASTLKEIMPVVQIEGRAIGEGRPGPITHRLLRMYRELTADDTTGDLP